MNQSVTDHNLNESYISESIFNESIPDEFQIEHENSVEFVQDMRQIVDNFRDESNFKDIKHWIRRLLIKKNNIKLLNFHINNETTPNQLFFDKFPTPFLNYDPFFVENYNKIIKKCQVEIMNESINRLRCQIKELRNNIKESKKKLNLPDDEKDDLISYLFKIVIKEKEKDFNDSHEKATRVVARPFIARQIVKSSQKSNEKGRKVSKNQNSKKFFQSNILQNNTNRPKHIGKYKSNDNIDQNNKSNQTKQSMKVNNSSKNNSKQQRPILNQGNNYQYQNSNKNMNNHRFKNDRVVNLGRIQSRKKSVSNDLNEDLYSHSETESVDNEENPFQFDKLIDQFCQNYKR
ncbi:hypothetical protein BpHYR1_036367 [Brachionus plicatilis]|uniref:Uncharacterized protein n=1 Tax=Brachionus plicatilis TaxID=10195 RepID=A0A3M7QQL3_BRAPC|nr:hypothetical protein BpHYR1_036367 [Brachionus plicatilis]